MRGAVAIVWVLALWSCSGGRSGASGGSDTATEGGEGTPPVETAAELEGFDMEGFEPTEPQIHHGAQSARELLGIHPPPKPWQSMSRSEQEYYMVGYVLPIHAELFREYDAVRYARFECANCHGDDGRERNFAMPSRYLPALPAEGSPEWQRMQERNPRGFAFMADHVLPTIRTQLGEPELTCYACHPRTTR
jgi:hypothetical protein